MSFFLAYGAEKLVHAFKDKRDRRTSAAPVDFDDMLHRLRNNDLINLRLGWHECNYVTTVRHIALLGKALRHNTSLRHVSIGWQMGKERTGQTLRMLGLSLRPEQLQSVQLVLNNAMSPPILTSFLQSQKALSTVDLQAISLKGAKSQTPLLPPSANTSFGRGRVVPHSQSSHSYAMPHTKRIRSRSPSARIRRKHRSEGQTPHALKESESSRSHGPSNGMVTYTSLIRLLWEPLQDFKTLTCLQLMDCSLEDEHALELSDLLRWHRSRHAVALASLSIRGNRRLSGRGVAALCRVPREQLDASLCDLSAEDATFIAEDISSGLCTDYASSTPVPIPLLSTLQDKNPSRCVPFLILSGNYRMDHDGVLAIASAATQHLRALDVSYCAMTGDSVAVDVFNAIAQQNGRSDACLEELIWHGCRVSSEESTEAMVNMIRQNTCLRKLQLHDPNNQPKYFNAHQLKQVAGAFVDNYELETLTVDFMRSIPERRAWEEAKFWLTLNQAGRRILRPRAIPECPSPVVSAQKDIQKALEKDKDDWFKVLEVAGSQEGLDHVFWVLQHSADRIGR